MRLIIIILVLVSVIVGYGFVADEILIHGRSMTYGAIVTYLNALFILLQIGLIITMGIKFGLINILTGFILSSLISSASYYFFRRISGFDKYR